MLAPTWIAVTERLPPEIPSHRRSDEVLAVVGFEYVQITLAWFDYADGQWVSADETCPVERTANHLVTHWLPLPPLPPPLPAAEVAARKRALCPLFESPDTVMWAVFEGVGAEQKDFRAGLRQAIAEVTGDDLAVRTSGSLKGGRFYLDFVAPDELALRRVQGLLAELPVPHTLTARGRSTQG